ELGDSCVDATADRRAIGVRAWRFKQLVAERLGSRLAVDHRPVDYNFLVSKTRPLQKQHTDTALPSGPYGFEDAGISERGGVTFALKLEFLAIDAARDIGRQHQKKIDGLRSARRRSAERCKRKRKRKREHEQCTAKQSAHDKEPSRFPNYCASIRVLGNAISTSVPSPTSLAMRKQA